MTGASTKKRELLYVRGLNWIGDAVLSLGALQGLRKVRPDLTVVVGAPPATADVYRLSRAVDSVIPPPSWKTGFPARYDKAVILPRSFRSALESFPLSGQRVGFASEGRSFLLTRPLSYEKWRAGHRHQSTYYETLFREVDSRVQFEAPRFAFSPEEIRRIRSRLGEEILSSAPLIAVNPGAYYGRAKTWPVHHFATLLSALLDQSPTARILLFSGQADRPLADEIAKRVADSRLRSLAGQLTLRESSAALSLCDFLITNDSGMMHLGGATGRKGLALFGPTDPVATGPVASLDGTGLRILRHPVSCQPCFLRECPIDHRCMERLEPDRVLAEVQNSLEDRR